MSWQQEKLSIKGGEYGWLLKQFDLREQIDFARKFGSPNAPVDTKCSVCGETFARHTKTKCNSDRFDLSSNPEWRTGEK